MDSPTEYVLESAPRRWGYTTGLSIKRIQKAVCPTQVGIHLCVPVWHRGRPCLPHAGGDTPERSTWRDWGIVSAPRRWGYTRFHDAGIFCWVVCPTQVGIHLLRRYRNYRYYRLPHAGGDTPHPKDVDRFKPLSAPRRWGYTGTIPSDNDYRGVCPTQVGIHLRQRPCSLSIKVSAPRRWGYTCR